VADDIVTRLRCNPCDCDGTCYTCQAAAEIERLRQRGDNLHALAMTMPNPVDNLGWLAWRTQMDNALMGWEEARRG
jgi:hypothetical protein